MINEMKDPAFLFYPNDYIGGTMGMTFEEKGAYIELLMMQFNRGHMTNHMIGQTVGQLWVKLEDKFTKDKKGLWFNERLEIEQKKRKAFTDSRVNNLKGVNQYAKKRGHMSNHMEDRDINENEIVIIYPFESENFKNQWHLWKQFKKKQFNFTYKSQISEQAILKKLSKLSEQNEQNAINIIHQSISECWKGFFKLTEDKKNRKINAGMLMQQIDKQWI